MPLLLEALRHPGVTPYSAGRCELALRLRGKWHAADQVASRIDRLAEARRRVEQSVIDFPPRFEPDHMFAAFTGPMPVDSPETAIERERLARYEDEWQEIADICRAEADTIEDEIDRADPAYIARRQEGALP